MPQLVSRTVIARRPIAASTSPAAIMTPSGEQTGVGVGVGAGRGMPVRVSDMGRVGTGPVGAGVVRARVVGVGPMTPGLPAPVGPGPPPAAVTCVLPQPTSRAPAASSGSARRSARVRWFVCGRVAFIRRSSHDRTPGPRPLRIGLRGRSAAG